MPLSVQGRRLAGAGLLLILFLVYLLLGSDRPPPSSVALVPPATRQPPAPPPIAAAPPAPLAPPVDASTLRLHGLLASGAVIAMPDGSQRLVPVGREILPGLTLRRVEQQHAVLASAGGEVRLGFDGVVPAQAAPGPATAPAATAAPAEAAVRAETLRYRLGLEPRRAGGRVSGFTMRPGVSMPALERAGLRPGDVIVRVNGSGFDEERMLELSWEIANSPRTEFEIERGGRPMRLVLEGAR